MRVVDVPAALPNEPVLATALIYEKFRRAEPVVAGQGFEVLRVLFESASASDADADAANDHFVFPMFVPPGGPFQEVVIILNGLNDSSYRKFFPWAASIARSGVPALIFPSAFLMNRRPRDWISPTATERAFQARLQVAPDTASPINAVLSLRVAQNPRALLQDAVRTAQDLRQLTRLASEGGLVRIQPGARCHFLGYSLGGYLALALKLHGHLSDGSKIVTFCAGASSDGATAVGLDPISPFILDRDATGVLLRDVDALRESAGQHAGIEATLVELFTGTSSPTRERIRELGSELFVIAGQADRIIPARGIEHNLGRIDATLPLGIHEYPFNLTVYEGAGIARAIARSHCVLPEFEPVFREFLGLVWQALALRPNATATQRSDPRSQTSC